VPRSEKSASQPLLRTGWQGTVATYVVQIPLLRSLYIVGLVKNMPIEEKDLVKAVNDAKEELFNKAHFPKNIEMFVLYYPEVKKVLNEMVKKLTGGI